MVRKRTKTKVSGTVVDAKALLTEDWDVDSHLRSFGVEEVSFSGGFLRFNPSQLSLGLKNDWLTLFSFLGIDSKHKGHKVTLNPRLDFQTFSLIEIGKEPALLGLGQLPFSLMEESGLLPVDGIRAEDLDISADLFLEYIHRRLTASIKRVWADKKRPIYFIEYLSSGLSGQEFAERYSILGGIDLDQTLAGKPFKWGVGLSQKSIGYLDNMMRAKPKPLAERSYRLPDDIEKPYSISIELITMAVNPDLLIDYVKPAACIDLDLPFDDTVFIRVDGRLWAKGKLGIYEGRFAVKLSEFELEEEPWPENSTRVQIEVANLELDDEQLEGLDHSGAIMLTNTKAKPIISMNVAGERVAKAAVSRSLDRFALKILG